LLEFLPGKTAHGPASRAIRGDEEEGSPSRVGATPLPTKLF